ncbi:MAG: DUF11 domain-containing protein, partial [Chloroflexi bacterium]|nr:DUF11 domain-containing protein [Chloroflexota bacterium]
SSCATTVLPLNDAPVNSVPAGFSVAEDTASPAMAFSIADPDAGANQIQFALSALHGSLMLDVTDSLTIVGGANGTYAITATGTLTDVNVALGGVSYLGDTDFSGSDAITLTSNDLGHAGEGGPLSDTDTVAVTVTGVNDAPVCRMTLPFEVPEDVWHTGLNFGITDVDAGTNAVQADLSAAHGLLSVPDTAGVTLAGSGTSAVTLTGALTAVNAALGNVGYCGVSNYAGPDVLTLTASDLGHSGAGGVLTATAAVSLTVTPVNDAPVATAPAAFSVVEDTDKSGLVFSVADVDAGSGQIMFTLGAAEGTVTLAGTSGLTIMDGANGTSLVAAQGTLADINAALNGVTYRGAPDKSGSDLLVFGVNDGGNTGDGGAMSHLVTTPVTVLSADTVTTLSQSSPVTVNGQTVTFTATVTSSVGVPTGAVLFVVDAGAPVTRTLDAGSAAYTPGALAVGTHTVVAQYLGASPHNDSLATAMHTVNRASTTLALTSSPNPALPGQTVTFTATVAAVAPGSGALAGVVTLNDGATPLGAAVPVDANGVATLAVISLGPGVHQITAQYGGTSALLPSTGTLAQTVGPVALTLDKTDERDTWYASWTWQYRLVLSNPNPVAVTNVVLTDTLPAQLTLVSVPTGAVRNTDGTVTWDLGTLAIGETRTLELWVRSLSSTRGALTNRALLSYDGGDPVMASDTTTIVAPPASVTPTPTSTPIVTPTPTPSVTPADVTVRGRVYGAGTAPAVAPGAVGLMGATVRAGLSGASYTDITDAEGRYEIVLPGSALQGCEQVSLDAACAGYAPVTRVLSLAELREQPEQDFSLLSGWTIWLPLTRR